MSARLCTTCGKIAGHEEWRMDTPTPTHIGCEGGTHTTPTKEDTMANEPKNLDDEVDALCYDLHLLTDGEIQEEAQSIAKECGVTEQVVQDAIDSNLEIAQQVDAERLAERRQLGISGL
tara:strand:- start:30 stop:386 length:357 start_codon:yes stop_codon:yes gene_type:complete